VTASVGAKRYGHRYLFAVYLLEREATQVAELAAARDVPRTVVLREAIAFYLAAKVPESG
jgi:hypothetical protein